MSLSKLRSFLYKTARFVGDVNAFKQGTVHKRIQKRMIGKATRKLF